MTTYLDTLLGGEDAFTELATSFTQPAVAANRQVSVRSTSALTAGLGVYVAGGGSYTVVSVDSATLVTLKNTGAAGNASPSSTVSAGGLVTANGAPGAPGSGGVSVANVDYVQVTALPAHSYSSGTQRITANSFGLIASSVFGANTGSNKRVEINALGAAAVENGIYVVLDWGSGGTAFTAQRATDFNETSDLASGVNWGVNSGSFQGMRRQLITQGPTLDSTPLVIDSVRAPVYTEIDLSAPPYNMVGFATKAEAEAYRVSGNCRNADALERFMRDSYSTNTFETSKPAIGMMLGTPPAGIVPMEKACYGKGRFAVHGRAVGANCFLWNPSVPQPRWYVAHNTSFPSMTDIPGRFGPTTGALPLETNPAYPYPYRSYDLTQTAGLSWKNGDAQLDVRIWWTPTQIDVGTSRWFGCQGRRFETSKLGVMLSVHTAAGIAYATLRTIDSMVLKQTAGTAHAVVLSTTGAGIRPEVPLHVQVLSANTFRYSDNDEFTWVTNPNAAPEADPEIHTFVAGVPYGLTGRARGATRANPPTNFITFPAGSYASNERYTTAQTKTIGANTAMVADGGSYEIAVSYNGTALSLAVNRLSSSSPAHVAAADPSPPTPVAQTGKIYSWACEIASLGYSFNTLFPGGATDLFPPLGYLTLLSINSVAGTAAREPILVNDGNTKLNYIPRKASDANSIIAADGTMWAQQTTTGQYVVPFVYDGAFTSYIDIQDVAIDTGGLPGTALTLFAPNFSKVKRFSTAGGAIGFRTYGGFFNEYEDWTLYCGGDGCVAVSDGVLEVTGICRLKCGGGIALASSAQGTAISKLDIDAEGYLDAMALITFGQTDLNFTFSDESCTTPDGHGPGFIGGWLLLDPLENQTARVSGYSSSINAAGPALTIGGSGGKVTYAANIARIHPSVAAMIATDAAKVNPLVEVELVAGYQKAPTAQNSNFPSMFLRTRDLPIVPIALADAAVTITRGQGERFRMAAGTTTTARTITLGTRGVKQWQTLDVNVLVQGHNVVIANGGGGGGTLDTNTAGSVLRRRYIFNGTDWEIFS